MKLAMSFLYSIARESKHCSDFSGLLHRMSLVKMDGNALAVSRPKDLDWKGLPHPPLAPEARIQPYSSPSERSTKSIILVS